MSTTTTGPSSASGEASEASNVPLDQHVARLVDAVTGLAEASAQPLTHALRVLGDNVGGRDKPQVRFHALERTGSELVSATIKLAENVVNLSLQALGVQGKSGAASAAPKVSVKRGETLRMPLSVENPSTREMRDLRFELSPIEGPAGALLSEQGMKLSPALLTIAPSDFEKLVFEAYVPEGAALGEYRGHIALVGEPSFRVPLRFEVTA